MWHLRAGVNRCEWQKHGTAGGQQIFEAIGASTGVGCNLRASTIQSIWSKAGGGANPSAFKSGPGGVAKFARGQAGGEKVGVIRRFYMQSILKWKK